MARAQGRKRSPHGEPMVYVQRRDANGNPTLWAGKVELPRDATGKRRHRYVYGTTEKAAAKKLITLKTQLRMHGDLPTADTPLGKFLDSWLRDVSEHVKPNTLRSYRTAVEKHIKPAIGKVRLGQLSAAHVRQMHAYLRTREGKKPLSSTTRHNAHRVLSIALNAALRDGSVTHNAAKNERAPRKAASTRTGLDLPAAVKVLELVIAGDVPLPSRWQVALVLGLRQGERLGLRWSHVDLDNGIADLAWALQRISYSHGCKALNDGWECGKKQGRSCPQRYLHIPDGMEHVPLEGNLVLMRPKTEGSQRVVALIEPLVEALKQRRAEVEAERPGYKIDHDLIWCSKTGGPIDPRDDWTDWHALLEAAGAPKVTLHEARHTVATLLLEADVDPEVIKSLLGHSSVVVTRSYQHVSLALQRKALEGLGRQLELTR